MKGCVIHTVQLNESRGFTLVEILIATFLFAVALLGIASLATVVIKGNSLSKQITTATLLAQQKMEENINKGYGNLCPSPTCPPNYPTYPHDLYPGYKRITVIGPGPVGDTLKLTVTVHRSFDNVSTSFYTIIAR